MHIPVRIEIYHAYILTSILMFRLMLQVGTSNPVNSKFHFSKPEILARIHDFMFKNNG